jgi:sugar/nucleoside kinase (ribokinase family)
MAKVLGMGNALVDIITQIENDDFLKEFGLPKGSMTLVDLDTSNYIHAETAGMCPNLKLRADLPPIPFTVWPTWA